MNPIRHRVLPALLALLATGFVLAQDGGGRPPEGASQDEKRTFYQNRAAMRPAGMGMAMRGGSGALWLSDSPPARGDGPPRAGMGGMGGMAMGGDRSGPPTKRLW